MTTITPQHFAQVALAIWFFWTLVSIRAFGWGAPIFGIIMTVVSFGIGVLATAVVMTALGY